MVCNMTEELKSFIERNIDLIEDRKFKELYDNTYAGWLNHLGIKPMDIRDLTAILTEVYGEEPILDDDLTFVPHYYLVANDKVIDVVIPEGIESIGGSAYRNCRNLQSLTLPKTLSEISDEAFKGCDKLGSIFYNGSKADWYHIKLGVQSFGSIGWIHQDKTIYCNDGEVIV